MSADRSTLDRGLTLALSALAVLSTVGPPPWSTSILDSCAGLNGLGLPPWLARLLFIASIGLLVIRAIIRTYRWLAARAITRLARLIARRLRESSRGR